MDFGDEIRVDFERSQVDDFATASACAKFKRLRFVVKATSKKVVHGGTQGFVFVFLRLSQDYIGMDAKKRWI
jgi:hypothetical protein